MTDHMQIPKLGNVHSNLANVYGSHSHYSSV